MRLNFTLLTYFVTLLIVQVNGTEKDFDSKTNAALLLRNGTESPAENKQTTAAVRKPVTVTLINSPAIIKQYNGNTAITLKPENYSLNGLDEADKGKVFVSGSASFSDANAGNNKLITVTNLTLSGPSADLYMLSSSTATVTGSITKAILTVTATDQQSCEGSIPTLTGSYSGFAGNDNEASLSSRPTFSTTANPRSKAGSYPINATGGSASNYLFNFVTGTLVLKAGPSITIKGSRALRISRGETLRLTATSTSASRFIWAESAGILSDRNSASVQVRPTESTTYTVTGTSTEGCTGTASVTVTVLDDYKTINARNILTPNNDSKNDTWIVENSDVYPNNEVTIFDRAGRTVYNKKGYDNSWDGTFQGSPLAQGTYYYVIDFGDGLGKFKGYISLLRR